jgi:hypothetical protein
MGETISQKNLWRSLAVEHGPSVEIMIAEIAANDGCFHV